MTPFTFPRNATPPAEWAAVCLKHSSYIKYCFQKAKLYKIGSVSKTEDYIECRSQKAQII